jgi:hypothetical protein
MPLPQHKRRNAFMHHDILPQLSPAERVALGSQVSSDVLDDQQRKKRTTSLFMLTADMTFSW